MTELSFLLELLLEHELTIETKTLIKERIREIEQKSQYTFVPNFIQPTVRDPAAQAPSILAKYPDLAVQPPTVIAQTPEAAKALSDRQAMITQALSGKRAEGQTQPRKIGRQ